MPIYEYECAQCGRRFEISQKMSDPVLTQCVLCQEGTVRKVLAPTAFVLKGSGWYKTDYASSGGAGQSSAADADKPCADAKTPAAGCAGGCACAASGKSA